MFFENSIHEHYVYIVSILSPAPPMPALPSQVHAVFIIIITYVCMHLCMYVCMYVYRYTPPADAEHIEFCKYGRVFRADHLGLHLLGEVYPRRRPILFHTAGTDCLESSI